MREHTPGPWNIRKVPTGRMGRDWSEIPGVVTCHSFERNGETQCGVYMSEANARLIAAAPDLLDALKMVLDDPEALQGRPRTYECVMEAIQKATGGEG